MAATIREKGYIKIYNESAATIQYQSRTVPGGWPNEKYQEADYSHLQPSEWSDWTNLAAGTYITLSVTTPYKDKDGNYNVNYWFDKDLEVRIRPLNGNSILKYFSAPYTDSSTPKSDASYLYLRYFTDDATSWPTWSVTCTCGYSATGNYYDDWVAIWVSESTPVNQLAMTITADNTTFIKCPIGRKDENSIASPYKCYFNNSGELEFWLQANTATDKIADVCDINRLQFAKLPSMEGSMYLSIPYEIEPQHYGWPLLQDSYTIDGSVNYSSNFRVRDYNHVKSFFLKLPPNKSMSYSYSVKTNSKLDCLLTIPVGESNTLLYPYAYRELADKQLKLLGKNAIGESSSSVALDFASSGHTLTWTYLDPINADCSFGSAYISINGGTWAKIASMTSKSCPKVSLNNVKTVQLKFSGLHDVDGVLADEQCYCNGLAISTPYAYKEAGIDHSGNVYQTLFGWDYGHYDEASGEYIDEYIVFDSNGKRYGKDLSAYSELISPVITLYGDATLVDIGSWICVAEGTQVSLADGNTKSIEDITYEDDILVWDFYEGKVSTAKPKFIKIEETADYYNLLKFSNNTELKLVGPGKDIGYHRIYNDESKSFTHTGVAETPIGTTTYSIDESYPTLVAQEVVNESVKYYNVITDKHYNLFANGILTSCRLSNKYAIENMKYVGEQLITDEYEAEYFAKIERLKVPKEAK